MNDATFNGWTNYPTWNLKLWIDNEEALHLEPVELLKACAERIDAGEGNSFADTREAKVRIMFVDALKEWAEETFLDPVTEATGGAGPHIDILLDGWGRINWHEIAQSYMDDNAEVWRAE